MLTIKRPTSTTVLYTVSTRSPPTTLAAHLRNAFLILIRLSAGFLTLLALLLEYQHLAANTAYSLPIHLQPTLPALRHASAISPTIRVCAYGLVLWLVLRKGYSSESLLVIRGLGVQTATAGSSFLWGGSTRFISASAVQDVFIHEAFRGFEVRFYLCIVVEGEEGAVVVFPVSLLLVSFCVPQNVISRRCLDNTLTCLNHRVRCLGGRFWKRYGEVQGRACTNPRREKLGSFMSFRIYVLIYSSAPVSSAVGRG